MHLTRWGAGQWENNDLSFEFEQKKMVHRETEESNEQLKSIKQEVSKKVTYEIQKRWGGVIMT